MALTPCVAATRIVSIKQILKRNRTDARRPLPGSATARVARSEAQVFRDNRWLMERNLTLDEVEALLRRVWGGHAHALVDILQASENYDQALAAVSDIFGLPTREAVIVMDQQLKLLVRMKPASTP